MIHMDEILTNDILLSCNTSIIIIHDEFFTVDLKFYDTKLTKDIAYIENNSDIVKIYRGKYKDNKKLLPGLYKEGKNIIEIEPTEYERQYYKISNVTELDLNKIFQTLTDKTNDFIHPDDVEIINNNTDMYVPTIKDEDDFLKYLVKKCIIDKKINLKNYKGRFVNHYALTNMKSSLNRSTKMTVTNFKLWCEILGLKWNMTIYDSGEDQLSPLPKPITITDDEF